MSRSGQSNRSRWAYPLTLTMLAVALAFPIALMIVNPTLMFERGWEQYLGTSIYLLAVVLLGRELIRFWSDERACDRAAEFLEDTRRIEPRDRRLLPARLRGLSSASRGVTVAHVMELNREASALDQEQVHGRFTITRYILYLLPVIGFIGTVEGISKALMKISEVLPQIKELDGFLTNLTGVTSALQIAFDSTLLALFLSAALMFVQTLVYRRAEELLARVDRWVVEHVLPLAAEPATPRHGLETLAPQLERIERGLGALNEGLGPMIDRFASAVDRLPGALAGLERGAEAIGRAGDQLEAIGQVADSTRKVVACLTRIEAAIAADAGPDDQLEQIRRTTERACVAIEGLAGQFSNAFERNSRTTQEQLARTLGSLKDALEMLQVSMEQGNALYRSIVKRLLPVYPASSDELAA